MDTFCGYQMEREFLGLYREREIHTNYEIALKNNKIEELLHEMEDLELFLNLLEKKSSEFKKEDPSHIADFPNQEEIDLVSRLIHSKDLGHIFLPAKYSWQEGEITELGKNVQEWISKWKNDDNMKRLINERIEGPLQRKINQETEKMILLQNESNELLPVVRAALHRMQTLIELIQRNMSK